MYEEQDSSEGPLNVIQQALQLLGDTVVTGGIKANPGLCALCHAPAFEPH